MKRILIICLLLLLIGYISISIFTYVDPEDKLLSNVSGFNDFAKMIKKESIIFSYDINNADIVLLYVNNKDITYKQIDKNDLGIYDKQKLDNMIQEMNTLGIQGFQYIGSGLFSIHFGDSNESLLYSESYKKDHYGNRGIVQYITGFWYLDIYMD